METDSGHLHMRHRSKLRRTMETGGGRDAVLVLKGVGVAPLNCVAVGNGGPTVEKANLPRVFQCDVPVFSGSKCP